jgi:hypothetical protein
MRPGGSHVGQRSLVIVLHVHQVGQSELLQVAKTLLFILCFHLRVGDFVGAFVGAFAGDFVGAFGGVDWGGEYGGDFVGVFGGVARGISRASSSAIIPTNTTANATTMATRSLRSLRVLTAASLPVSALALSGHLSGATTPTACAILAYTITLLQSIRPQSTAAGQIASGTCGRGGAVGCMPWLYAVGCMPWPYAVAVCRRLYAVSVYAIAKATTDLLYVVVSLYI